jgi:SAM-dependent methyltransferase
MHENASADTGGRPFAGRASLYARFRRDYPAEFILRLRQLTADGGGRVLDLGCGTGQLALQLAPFFEEAVGLDPEPDMLREAERVARKRGIANVRWIQASSHDLERLQRSLGYFDLATVGTAFHLMEAHATLAVLQRISSAVAVAYAGAPMWLHADAWAKALRRVLEERFGRLEDLDFTADALDVCEATVRALGYASIERWQSTYEEMIDVSFVVGHILSATSTDQIQAAQEQSFEDEVRSAILAVAPSGRLVETVPVRAIIASTGHAGQA